MRIFTTGAELRKFLDEAEYDVVLKSNKKLWTKNEKIGEYKTNETNRDKEIKDGNELKDFKDGRYENNRIDSF